VTTTITLEDADKQLVLLALAALSLESPGFDMALNLIAAKLDNVQDGRAVQYDSFRAVHETHVPGAQRQAIEDDAVEAFNDRLGALIAGLKSGGWRKSP